MPTLVNTREGDKNHQNSFSVESERPHMENIKLTHRMASGQ